MIQATTPTLLISAQEKAVSKANEIATFVSEMFASGRMPYKQQRAQLVDFCKLMSIQIHTNMTEQGKTKDETLKTLLQHYNLKLNEKNLANLRYFDLKATGTDFASHRLLHEGKLVEDLTDSLSLLLELHYFYTFSINKPSVCSSYLTQLIFELTDGELDITVYDSI